MVDISQILAATRERKGYLECRLGEENAIIGKDANSVAIEATKPGYKGWSIEGLELIETTAIQNARKDLRVRYSQVIKHCASNDAVVKATNSYKPCVYQKVCEDRRAQCCRVREQDKEAPRWAPAALFG